MGQLNAALAVTGAIVVLVGLLSNPIKKSLLQEPTVAVLVGIATGPYGLGWLDVATWGDETAVLEQAARLTLASGLMGVALRLKQESVRILCSATMNVTGQRQDGLHPMVEQTACSQGLVKPLPRRRLRTQQTTQTPEHRETAYPLTHREITTPSGERKWIAECADLPYCVVSADTEEAALEQGRVARETWLATAAALGIDPSAPQSVTEAKGQLELRVPCRGDA